MKIAVASGKGGTGKTTVAVNLVHTILNTTNIEVTLLDCDVEAANDDLFINAKFDTEFEATCMRPEWDSSSCTSCGLCVDVCQYNAIAKVKDKILIFDELCHSCNACSHLCPSRALVQKEKAIGKIQTSNNRDKFTFGQGELNIGESLSPLVIGKLKEAVKETEITLYDCPPGMTCPVVKTLEGVDGCILVAESTPFGVSDLELVAQLAQSMQIKCGIVINKSDGVDSIIEKFAIKSSLPIIGRIPFNKKYAYSYSIGKILVDVHPELLPIFEEIIQATSGQLKMPKLGKNKIFKKIAEVQHNIENDTNSTPVKELVVISGKGGTGKTTLTSSFCNLSQNHIIADCDVDASNMEIIIRGKRVESNEFVGGQTYIIDKDSCTNCGLCHINCTFNAILFENNQYKIDPNKCEGCGLCQRICKSNSISSIDRVSGEWIISHSKNGKMSHAKLGVGEDNSGKLVSFVRSNAHKLAKDPTINKIISDGPPGIGCPTISSLTGADMAIIVTEPTLSGIHDMERAIQLTKHFNVPTHIVINKYDINTSLSNQVESSANDMGVKVIGTIPYDSYINIAHESNQTITELNIGIANDSIRLIWSEILKQLTRESK